ncbi:MAG TPA: DUF1223 domain-containing protein [Terriglobia bacterium]|nr:DUF1223 domain-containing protein [Terriglobia bacterium]
MITRYVTLFAALVLAGGSAEPAGPRRPILLELFTSEGCSSCPPADRLLETFDRTQPVSGADLIVLSEHVDYWNRLGWTDPYSSPLFTERQQEYVRHLHLEGAYTPQLVMDGQADFVGSDERAIRAGILRAETRPKAAVSVRAQHVGSEVKVSLEAGDRMRPAELYLALANDPAQSQVTRGENSGRTLGHVAVVRNLIRVASLPAHGTFAKELTLPLKNENARPWRAVAFLQDSGTGQILGAAEARL